MNVGDWLGKNTVYVVPAGSRLYGTFTAESDFDYRGAAVPPKNYFFGLDNFEQSDSKETIVFVTQDLRADLPSDADITIWSLKKMIQLAADGNPNMIELMFSPEDAIVHAHPMMNKFFDIREAFLSKLLKHRFSGYAMQQLKRMRNHHRWMHNPPTYPTREEYGIEDIKFPKDQIQAAEKMIELQVDEWLVDQDHLPEDIKIQLGPQMIRMVNVITEQLYIEANIDRLKDVLERAANRTLGFDSDFLNFLQRFKQYKNHLADWNHYENWKKNRNPARAVLEAKWGYDCYLDDTEFLTKSGWKTYDNIKGGEELATLNQETGQMEFQKPFDRVAKDYSGPVYTFETHHTKCSVTPNHRMWVSDMHRQKSNGFSSSFVEKDSNWRIVKAEDILAGRRSHFHIRATCTSGPDYPVEDDYLLLVGAYVSEGCVGKRTKDGSPATLRISQMEEGKLIPIMNKILASNTTARIFDSKRKTGKVEKILTISDKDLSKRVVGDCGEYSATKYLPEWVMYLSKRQVELLLVAMVAGDGTQRPYSRIYYTTSKTVADMTQAMCVQCGIESDVWGPYQYKGETPMWQVYIGKEREVVSLRKTEHLLQETVENGRIVCFSVPNEMLITRRHGKVSIQGNTKHAQHLVRLLRMAREILEGKGVIVRRPDAVELRELRERGTWKYEALIEWAETEDKALDLVMNESALPKSPNRKLINKVLTEETNKYLMAGIGE